MHSGILFAFLATRAHCCPHGQLAINQESKVLLHGAALQQVNFEPVLVYSVIPLQFQDPIPCWTSLGSSLSSCPVCPDLTSWQHSLMTCFSHSSMLGIMSKCAEGIFYLFFKVIGEYVEQDWVQHRPLGDTTQLDSVLLTTTLWTLFLDSSQFISPTTLLRHFLSLPTSMLWETVVPLC